MNENNVANELVLLNNRIDRMENMLKKFLETQKSSQDIEEVENFYWQYDSESKIPNIYPYDSGDKFVWLGPQPMTQLNFFLKKDTMYRIELNISSLPPTLESDSVNIIVNNKKLNLNVSNNIYTSLFKSEPNDGLSSVYFGTEKTVNPSKLQLGLDTRELSIALHSILLKVEN